MQGSATSGLSGPGLRPLADGPARSLLVLLHGYGADGADLMGLAPALRTALPETEILAPDAPFPCEQGFGRQWFSLLDRSPPAMRDGVVAAAPILESYLAAQLAARGLDGSRLMLAGFSQGCMMALHVGLRRTVAPAAIVALSGVLLGADALAGEIRCRPPVLVVHGALDDIVPASTVAHTVEALERAAVSVTSLVIPTLGHGIDATAEAAALAFLGEHRPGRPGA